MAFSSSSFSFGQTSALGFGASTAPATSAPLFGGNPSSAPFGASSGNLFAAASTPSFGAVSTPAFSAPTGSLFGATPAVSSAPAFGSLFGGASSASAFNVSSTPAFGATGSLFASSAAQTAAVATNTSSSLWQPQAQTAAQQVQSSSILTYNTKWEEIPQHVQQQLLQLQQLISSSRDDCEKLDRDQRLHDHVQLKKTLQEETGALKQSLQGLLNAVQVDDDAAIKFREKVMKLMHSTEAAVRTYQRAKLWREAPRGQALPAAVQEQLAAPVVLPSPYLELAVKAFEEALSDYRQLVSQLEQALPSSSLPFGDNNNMLTGESLVQSLPTIISNMYQYMVHVAAALESVHNKVRDAREAFLSKRRAQGDYSNPFQQRSSNSDVFSTRSFSANAAAVNSGAGSGSAPGGTNNPGSHSLALMPSVPAQPAAAAGGLLGAAGAAPAPFGASNSANGFQTPQNNNMARSKSNASRSKSRR